MVEQLLVTMVRSGVVQLLVTVDGEGLEGTVSTCGRVVCVMHVTTHVIKLFKCDTSFRIVSRRTPALITCKV